jgi:hypothetical protein
MNSNTSSDLDINYINNDDNKIGDNGIQKKESSETDMYLNLVVNPSKVAENEPNSTTSLQLDDSESNNLSTSSIKNSSVSSQVNFETVKIGKSETIKNPSKKISRKKSRISSVASSRSSSRRSEINLNQDTNEEPKVVLTQQQTRFKKT